MISWERESNGLATHFNCFRFQVDGSYGEAGVDSNRNHRRQVSGVTGKIKLYDFMQLNSAIGEANRFSTNSAQNDQRFPHLKEFIL